ncbi:unnamed protein product [Nesidiocoris tenuis]|uniref:Uncharacterized protein n=1 Tax=Nesidiocoris tenuis TaxID=355587 RepID=A0A6H5G387_9HEMI|nr:unnamed protein product [Nesidiocoris tenuis]
MPAKISLGIVRRETPLGAFLSRKCLSENRASGSGGDMDSLNLRTSPTIAVARCKKGTSTDGPEGGLRRCGSKNELSCVAPELRSELVRPAPSGHLAAEGIDSAPLYPQIRNRVAVVERPDFVLYSYCKLKILLYTKVDIMSDAIEPIPEEEVLALFLAKNDDQDAKGVSEDGESEAEAGELQAEEGELIDEVRNPIVFNSLYDWWLKSWWSNEVNGMRSILEINYTFKDVE